MVRILLSLVIISPFLMSVPYAAPQQSRKPSVKLSNAKSMTPSIVKLLAGGSKTTWSLAFQFQHQQYTPVKADAIITAIDSLPNTIDTRRSLIGHESRAKELLSRLTIVGGKYLYFLVDPSESLPIMIAEDKAGKHLVIIAATDSVYNTLRLSTKQRAAKTLSELAIPIARDAADIFGSKIQQIAVYIVYGSKNFVRDDYNNLQPELVGLITKPSTVKAFVSTAVTDQEFIDRSIVMLSDRDSFLQLTRIKVTLE